MFEGKYLSRLRGWCASEALFRFFVAFFAREASCRDPMPAPRTTYPFSSSSLKYGTSTEYGILCIRVFHHLSHDRRTCRMSIAGDQTAGKRQHCFCPSMLSHGVWSRKYKVRISPGATSKITNRCPIPRIASYALRSQDGTGSSGGWPFASHSRYSMDARSAAGGWVWREMIWQLDWAYGAMGISIECPVGSTSDLKRAKIER